jgi:hypothetical protein
LVGDDCEGFNKRYNEHDSSTGGEICKAAVEVGLEQQLSYVIIQLGMGKKATPNRSPDKQQQ